MKKYNTLYFYIIDKIWIFGSRARGDYKERSELDLAIICPNATEIYWLKIMDIIENADIFLPVFKFKQFCS